MLIKQDQFHSSRIFSHSLSLFLFLSLFCVLLYISFYSLNLAKHTRTLIVRVLFMVLEQFIPANSSTMAALSSAMASSSTAPSSYTVNVMNQPLILLYKMKNMMTVKLDNTNYIVWKHQITMILETYSMFELLEEPQLIPKKYLKNLSGSFITILNLDYLNWRSKEKNLLTFMSSTLSPTISALTVGCSTAMEVWKVLENKFYSFSRSHAMNIKGELHNIKKGSDSVDLYL